MLCKVRQPHIHKQGVYSNEYNLSHTGWKCKYHIVFSPKYRRKNIYGVLKSDWSLVYFLFFRPASLTGRDFDVILMMLQLAVGLVVKLDTHFSKLFFCVPFEQVAFAHQGKNHNIAKCRKELLHVVFSFFCFCLANGWRSSIWTADF